MKTKIKKIAYGVASAGLLAPMIALGDVATDPAGGFSDAPSETSISEGTFYNILDNVMTWLLGIVAVLGIIGFAISGIMYLTAAGDEDRMSTAKKAMVYSIIGIAVALLGLVAVKTIASILGGAGGASGGF